MNESRWLLIGEDQRMEECARFLKEKGLDVSVYPSDEVKDALTIKIKDMRPTHVVLPIQGVKGFLSAELFETPIMIFTGIIKEAQLVELETKGHHVQNYLKDERFVWKNAHLTAEGFIKEFYSGTSETISNTEFQIAGFGRVGRMLAHVLVAGGANLTIFARSEAQLGEASALGLNVKKLSNDAVFEPTYLINTIPAQWLNIASDNTLRIFDLASKPGCLRDGVTSAYYTLHLGLPGKHFPQQAASYLAETLLRMCKGKE